MRERIERVAVLGSGVMGAGIAAHLANAGVPCLLLDMVPKELSEEEKKAGLATRDPRFRNRLANRALEGLARAKPPLLYHPKFLPLATPGNFEDDLPKLAECDWVIEAVVERLDAKRALFEKVEAAVRPGTVVSSNTSGLSIAAMVQGRSDAFRRNFLVTHFFNPVRYMYLLELVAGEETNPAVVEEIARFGTFRLGKGIVHGKDTPNFVANRIGVYGLMATLHAALAMGYRFDEADAITGPALGRASSASFGTADLVGLDTFLHAVRTILDGCPQDEALDTFRPPALLERMVARGALGRKSGAGFFKMEKTPDGKRRLLVLDPALGDYVPEQRSDFPSLKAASKLPGADARICAVVGAEDRAGAFARRILHGTLSYAAHRLGEIADTVVAVDAALRWGFNWELGPFETWDALGVEETAHRMEESGANVPGWVWEMVHSGFPSFYRDGEAGREFYSPRDKAYLPVPRPESFLVLKDLKRQRPPILGNAGGSLVDLGDGVACLEFHSASQPRLNPIDGQVVEVMALGLARAEKDFRGLVVHHQAEQFCAGADLAMLLEAAKEKQWDAIAALVRRFQAGTMGMRRAKIPVVTAPFGFTFGGGAEVAMAGDALCAQAELYMGLVEVGVGLVPAGGGHLFMLDRVLEGIDAPVLSNLPFLQRAFETIAMAKVSGSAEEARSLKYLRPWDHVEIQRGRQLHAAKRMALALAERGYHPPLPRTYALPGRDGLATFQMLLHNMRLTHWASDHDVTVGTHVANILCGGDTTVASPVTEERVLELEHEAFLSLCGEEKTVARIQHMLETGKPLRN